MLGVIHQKGFAALCLLSIGLLSYKNLPSARQHSSVTHGFALIELFTSEGCSSCPPADEAVGRLNRWKENVFILSFHVDYWNYLGWKDEFSNAAYSTRQQFYGDLFHLSSIYTPQIIVNGRTQFVGSDETRLRETIESDLKDIPNTAMEIKIRPENKNQIYVEWTTHRDPEMKVNLALVQNFSKNQITRGENKGMTLNHYFTVREFKSFADTGPNTAYLNIPTGLKSSDCSIVAFLQNPRTGYIIAASNSSIP